MLRKHLDYKLYNWLKGKGRRAHKSLRQRPYRYLVSHKHLLDLEKYARLKTLANAHLRTLRVSRVRENFKHGLMKGALLAQNYLLSLTDINREPAGSTLLGKFK
jgi:hypothetical protein